MSKRKYPFKKMLTVTEADRADIARADNTSTTTELMRDIVEAAVDNCLMLGVPEHLAVKCLMHMMAHRTVSVIGLDGVETTCHEILSIVKEVRP